MSDEAIMTLSSKLMAALVFATVMAGCSDRLALNQEPSTFGNAVRHNIEAQTVNPMPQPAAGPIPMDGSRAAGAMERYQTDHVKQPRSLQTTTVIQGGSGSAK
jgi:hypothetical protein